MSIRIIDLALQISIMSRVNYEHYCSNTCTWRFSVTLISRGRLDLQSSGKAPSKVQQFASGRSLPYTTLSRTDNSYECPAMWNGWWPQAWALNCGFDGGVRWTCLESSRFRVVEPAPVSLIPSTSAVVLRYVALCCIVLCCVGLCCVGLGWIGVRWGALGWVGWVRWVGWGGLDSEA